LEDLDEARDLLFYYITNPTFVQTLSATSAGFFSGSGSLPPATLHMESTQLRR